MPRSMILLCLAACTWGAGASNPAGRGETELGTVATSTWTTTSPWTTGTGTTWTTIDTGYGYTGYTGYGYTGGYYTYTGGYHTYTGYSPYYYTGYTTTWYGYTTPPDCDCSVIHLTINRDGVPTDPDFIRIDIGNGQQGLGEVGATGGNGVFEIRYCDDECTIIVTMGPQQQTLHCEDFLRPPETGVCGQDADLDFSFDGPGTTPGGTTTGTAGGTTTGTAGGTPTTGTLPTSDSGGGKDDGGCGGCDTTTGGAAVVWLFLLGIVARRFDP